MTATQRTPKNIFFLQNLHTYFKYLDERIYAQCIVYNLYMPCVSYIVYFVSISLAYTTGHFCFVVLFHLSLGLPMIIQQVIHSAACNNNNNNSFYLSINEYL